MAELQKDPITRSDFLGFGVMGAIVGAILTIPPAAFVLGPVIKTNVLGNSDVSPSWQEVGPVSEVKEDKPSVFTVEFPIEQAYGDKSIQGKLPGGEKGTTQFTVRNAIWVSWKAEVKKQGRQGSGGDELAAAKRPAILDRKSKGFTESERKELLSKLNVLSSSCAHLGCPVRWVPGQKLFLCPCHGSLYDINGGWVGGPAPRGLYRYTETEIRENGKLYVKHKYDSGGKQGPQEPYVV